MTGSDPAQTLYATEAALTGAIQVATTYAGLPACSTGASLCSNPAVVSKMITDAQAASSAVLTAQGVVTAKGTAAQIAAAVAAAKAAVSALQADTSTVKVK